MITTEKQFDVRNNFWIYMVFDSPTSVVTQRMPLIVEGTTVKGRILLNADHKGKLIEV